MEELALEIKNLEFAYPDGRKALNGVNLAVKKGETAGLIGHNGAGKSTLIMHLNGLIQGRGEIRVMGLTVEKKNLRKIRKSTGIVFQNPDDQLFMPTVFEDIAFGPLNFGFTPAEAGEKVIKVMADVGLSGYEKRLPHHLSCGEKKRVAIATVLSMEPDLIVLDEPSSNLDPKGRRGLINLLKTLDVTKIIATHDLELVRELCSKVIVMTRGKIVATGNTFEILSNEKLLLENDLEMPLSIKYKPEEA